MIMYEIGVTVMKRSLKVISAFQAFDPPFGIYDSLFPCEKGMTTTTYLYPQGRFGGSSSKRVAAKACHDCFGIPIRMDLCLHSASSLSG